ncbi:hypothetical protein OAQ99_04485 [Candidatus Kapabacteria bacterium]|nr:hypothetical protein [Candidatus Kapabacteria bacterium]
MNKDKVLQLLKNASGEKKGEFNGSSFELKVENVLGKYDRYSITAIPNQNLTPISRSLGIKTGVEILVITVQNGNINVISNNGNFNQAEIIEEIREYYNVD